MIDKKLIAQRIRDCRKAENLSQELLAEWANISTAYLNKIENGKSTNISMEIIAAISDTMRVSLDYLVFGKTDETSDKDNFNERLFLGCTEHEKVILVSMLNALKQIIIENREE
ncbi:MAG: helix-turn-helix transcriptional regulator [Saccharofermentans sp.]|nr:helix-turn-helix transcriptional regulator [Saccharofermentans sp.]